MRWACRRAQAGRQSPTSEYFLAAPRGWLGLRTDALFG
jgi:hypothetical protein